MTSFYIISFNIGGAINDLSCDCVRFLYLLWLRLKYGFYFYVFSTLSSSYLYYTPILTRILSFIEVLMPLIVVCSRTFWVESCPECFLCSRFLLGIDQSHHSYKGGIECCKDWTMICLSFATPLGVWASLSGKCRMYFCTSSYMILPCAWWCCRFCI